MGSKKNLYRLIVLLFGILFCISCKTEINENIQNIDRKPDIEPDYSDVTIPPNIAPMNFSIREEGDFFNVIATSGLSGYQIKIKSSHGMIRFPEKLWRKLVNESMGDTIEFQIYASKKQGGAIEEYNPFSMIVARERIDPYLVYRLIHPGY